MSKSEAELIVLAERFETATDDDRALFEDAFRACFPKPANTWVDEERSAWTTEYEEWQERQSAFYEFLEAGASLDAAMTLVPEGWFWRVGHSTLYEGWAATNRVHPDHCERDAETFAKAATPALALCAAALKASAHD